MATTVGRGRYEGVDSAGLLELVRAGDPEAYGELFVRYHDFAHRVARRANRRHAEDLVAEAFRRVLTAIQRGAGPREAFGPYLATTIRSVAAGLAAPYQDVELDVSTILVDDHGDVDPRVATAYTSLPESWQQALWYSEVEGMSPRHAAPLLGLPSANAFSALRKRAQAGLRSSYLTLVVDDACNDEIREHLSMLVAGTTTPETVDGLVDEHLGSCSTCAAIAWRIEAVAGRRLGAVLGPAVVAFHGFGVASALLPAGLGATGLVGWFRRNSQAAVTGAVAASVALVVAGLIAVATGGNGDGPSDVAADRPSAEADASGGGDEEVPPAAPAIDEASISSEPSTTSTTTTSTTTTSTTTTSTTTTSTTTTTTTTTSTSTTTATPPPTTAPVLPGAATTVPSAVVTTTLPTVTTTTLVTTTLPTVTTTTPATTTLPTVTTTTPATTTTTTPATTTTTTTPATTAPPTTTTTTTTVPPVVSPGVLSVDSDLLIGSGGTTRRDVVVRVLGLTGAPGTVTFSSPIQVSFVTSNLSCGGSTCVLSGAVAPATATAALRFASAPLTIRLLDASGAVVDSYTSPGG